MQPGEALQAELDKIESPLSRVGGIVLCELIYTAEESGLFTGDGMSINDAVVAYKLITLARSFNGNPCPEQFRM